MSSITDYLEQIQKLTNRNIEILNALNQSFLTKAEHLSVKIGEEKYVIPSFLALENKVNMLEDNLYNIINAPKTGEAAFDFNGNTQQIEVKGFSNTPAKALEGVKTDQYLEFGQESNAIFKDFCTPKPYIHLELTSLPTCISQVNVKKVVIPQDAEFLSIFTNTLGDSSVSVPFEYSELVKKLSPYTKGTDYTEYDTLMTLPIRDNVGHGTYKIQEIVKNWTDTNLEEHYTLRLDNINYYIKDETIQKQLNIGDFLVTNNDKCKLEIEDVKVTTQTITVKVCYSGYADLVAESDGDTALSTLKYMNDGNFDSYKYINVPLEEDRYVIVFVAPIERNSLIQAPWGTGILFDVDRMYCNINGTTYYFRDYYNRFVSNIGDTLTSLTDLFGESFVNYSENKFNTLVNAKPAIDADKLSVIEINKHLNNNSTIQEIYGLYKQKQNYKTQLQEKQKEIDDVNALLASTSFQDTRNNRTIYEQQLASLNAQKKELNTNITSIISEIATAATDTDTPIDNPKYHIRGFFDYKTFIESIGSPSLAKIDVQYRYKNANKATGNATTISGDDIYSDWNSMESIWNTRVSKFDGKVVYKTPEDSTNLNEISFNQFDIPISQGESVDIRMRVIYSVGQPFVNTYSQWSDMVNIPFPEEFKQKVTVLDIISENNEDATKYSFTSILDKEGVTDHVASKIVDQDITYFHKPDDISSGFFTDERRIIPLKDKLQQMSDDIIALKDEVMGTEVEDVEVVLSDSTHETVCHSFALNSHTLIDFENATKSKIGDCAEQILSLTLTNKSDHSVKLFSIFPGVSDYTIDGGVCKYTKKDYVDKNSSNNIYWFTSALYKTKLQYLNQWLYFRRTNAYSTDNFVNYAVKNEVKDNIQYIPTDNMQIAPINDNKQDIVIKGDSYSYKLIKSGESLTVPIYVTYTNENNTAYFGFDIRTSLYKDPTSYSIQLVSKKKSSLNDKIKMPVKTTKYDPVTIKASRVADISSLKNKRLQTSKLTTL